MTKKTIENFVNTMVLDKLNEYFYAHYDFILELFEDICISSEDLREVSDIIINSKDYNYVQLQDGQAYIFSKTNMTDVREFFNEIKINDDDPAWNKYVYKYGGSMTLKELYEEVMF